MPLLPTLHLGKAAIHAWHLTETAEALLSLLPEAIRHDDATLNILKHGSAHRRQEKLAVSILLRTVANIDKPIAYTPEGKPTLPGTGLHLSISHTADYACIALSTEPVGIDVEMKRDKALKLAPRFLNEEELKLLANGTDEATTATLLWSAKEAAFKRADPAVDFFSGIRIGSVSSTRITLKEPAEINISYRIFNDAVVTLAE